MNFAIPEIVMADPHLALIRAYDGEPLKRVVVHEGRDCYYVANPKLIDVILQGTSGPIGFRRHDCFSWNANAFERLAELYATQGHTDHEAWIGLPPFTGRPLMPTPSATQ
ncbi:hypothetical protein [Methylobacterium komagatae]